jgi:hypothetical protein
LLLLELAALLQAQEIIWNWWTKKYRFDYSFDMHFVISSWMIYLLFLALNSLYRITNSNFKTCMLFVLKEILCNYFWIWISLMNDDNLFNIFLIFSSLGTWIHVFVSLTLGWGLGGEEGRHWLAILAYI